MMVFKVGATHLVPSASRISFNPNTEPSSSFFTLSTERGASACKKYRNYVDNSIEGTQRNRLVVMQPGSADSTTLEELKQY